MSLRSQRPRYGNRDAGTETGRASPAKIAAIGQIGFLEHFPGQLSYAPWRTTLDLIPSRDAVCGLTSFSGPLANGIKIP